MGNSDEGCRLMRRQRSRWLGHMTRSVVGAALSASVAAIALPSIAEPVGKAEANRCAALTTLTLPTAKVVRATAVSKGSLVTGSVIAAGDFCRVEVTATTSPTSELNVEIWLPLSTAWNKRFLGAGNGGAAGKIVYGELRDGVARGYATANTDLGTHASQGFDAFRVLIGKPQTQIDLAYRGTHAMTDVGKAVTRAYYGQSPAHSLFFGCSGGGEEALSESQRYPEDYDGIAAGHPPVDATYEAMLQGQVYADSHRDPASVIGREKLPAIALEVLNECDGLDGLKDGLINDPRRCLFDPSRLECAQGVDTPDCLTAPQVAALRRIYGGLRGPGGELLYAGFPPGAENTMGALSRIAGLNSGSLVNPATPGSLVWTLGASWVADSWLSFDFRTQMAPIAEKARWSESSNPDLRAFANRGGKIIFFSGWHDALQNPAQLIAYFEKVQATSGGPAAANAFARLFLFPGMGHCEATSYFGRAAESELTPHFGEPKYDVLAALDRWVTSGAAPDELISFKHPDGDPKQPVIRSIPACVYPRISRWTGRGSVLDGATYVCVNPED